MIVNQISRVCCQITFTGEEIELLEIDSANDYDWMVINVPTLLEYVLERHLDECRLRNES